MNPDNFPTGNMDEETRQEIASALPRLSAEQFAEVSPHLKREQYGSGEVIIRQGDAADRFYIVIEGRAQIEHEALSGHTGTIDYRLPGEYFGEIGLLQGRPRTATVRVPDNETLEVLALDRQDFEEMMDESRATEMHIAQEMMQRLIQLADAQD